MSQLRTAKAGDQAAFPGATFVVDDTPPIAQCQEARIFDVGPSWTATESTITISASLAALDVTGKVCLIADSASDDGTYDVLSQNGQILTLDHIFVGATGIAMAFVQDSAGNYLTRNESSFRKFIENEGKAHTTKGGQLFTDVASGPMADACSDTFNPQ